MISMSLSSTAVGYDLTSYRWNSRLLLVFSPYGSDTRFAAHDQDMSKARAEMEDRDLIVLRIFERVASRWGDPPLARDRAENLRRRFGVEAGQLKVILIGKDGGIKMVCEAEVGLQKIFDRIDSMPMRQQEMKEKRPT